VEAACNDRSESALFGRFACHLLFTGALPAIGGARGGGLPHDGPWDAEHVDRLPPDVRNLVFHMCGVRPSAARYFATYLDDARIIRLHFEYFNCEGTQAHHDAGRCLHEEFALTGSHYRLTKNCYGRCDD
jgi:hypothetical protein